MSCAVSQFPNQPGIDSPKEQFALFSSFLCSLNMVQNPANLGSREVSVNNQTSLFVEFFHIALAFQLFSQRSSLARLPNDSIIDRKTCIFIPNDSCFTLVGDSDGFDLIRFDSTFDEGTCDNGLNRVPNFIGIVLNPSSLRENLSKFFLTGANFFSFFVKDDGAGTSSSLVDGHDVFFL